MPDIYKDCKNQNCIVFVFYKTTASSSSVTWLSLVCSWWNRVSSSLFTSTSALTSHTWAESDSKYTHISTQKCAHKHTHTQMGIFLFSSLKDSFACLFVRSLFLRNNQLLHSFIFLLSNVKLQSSCLMVTFKCSIALLENSSYAKINYWPILSKQYMKIAYKSTGLSITTTPCEIIQIAFITWLFQILWKITIDTGIYVNSALCFHCACWCIY